VIIPTSREVASIPLIQFIGGWKWYPVLSRGLTMEAGTDGGAASASRLRWMTWEAPATCSASSSTAHGARTRCRVPIAFLRMRQQEEGDGFGRWMVRRPGRVGGFYRKKLHVLARSTGWLVEYYKPMAIRAVSLVSCSKTSHWAPCRGGRPLFCHWRNKFNYYDLIPREVTTRALFNCKIFCRIF
jgi:hypothetical protein